MTVRPTVANARRPLMPRHVWTIRARLELGSSIRDLVHFNLAVDSKLRDCDLVRLRLEDIGGAGHIHERATMVQQKTGRAVRFEITEPTRQSIERWLPHLRDLGLHFLFPSR